MKAISLFFFFLSLASLSEGASVTQIWIGTGGGDAKGIYRVEMNPETGALSPPVLAAEIDGPGFLCLSRDGSRLWTLSRTADRQGSVTAFSVSEGKDLEKINEQVIGDGGAAHIAVSRDESLLFTAQYGAGSVAVFPLEANGSVGPRSDLVRHEGSGPDPTRQKAPHPHWVGMGPENRFLYVPDLGIDQVVIYRVDFEEGKLERHGTAATIPGGGPRHLAFSPDGGYAYLVNELLMSTSVYRADAEGGTLERIQVAANLPDNALEIPNKASEIRVHPTGRFVYTANRGHDTITAFAVGTDGTLSTIEQEPIRGSWPRNFNIDPSGRFLVAAGRYSNTLSVFRIDPDTGGLIFTGKMTNVPAPICVVFGKEG